ncbi:hypothetical protein C5E08_13760 [Rathayibacter iranicus]|uniref:Uncharacterized protein n=2 Tax=Rathayibacter iranicus TaxID=59737 RepID=A0AAD1AHN6_9MICO|nr:hypothetical protein C7V51_14000 [Rathayibacter iranicus]PPI42538.1 hypothetical protein C5E09_12855 [Rathayibacter iranicus]PPI58000.1 hypothetical protein C5E08_13760 [Rathayibacter iranicus]PPI68911.1 hypothetical protein C5E01_12810 [Rathayibacter iranicus]PWJ61985.1 hypothetical protein B0H03_1138 [Rathayibacter iranicus NCPPB 2253 = VKM Ac-1602]
MIAGIAAGGYVALVKTTGTLPEARIFLRAGPAVTNFRREWGALLEARIGAVAPAATLRQQTDHLVVGIRERSPSECVLALGAILATLVEVRALPIGCLLDLEAAPAAGPFEFLADQIWAERPDWAETAFPQFSAEDIDVASPIGLNDQIVVLTSGLAAATLTAVLESIPVEGMADRQVPPHRQDTRPSSHRTMAGGNARRSVMFVASWTPALGGETGVAYLAASQYLLGGEGSQIFDQLRDRHRLVYSLSTQPYRSLSGNLSVADFSIELGRESEARDVVASVLAGAYGTNYADEATAALAGFSRWVHFGQGRGFLLDMLTQVITNVDRPVDLLEDPSTILRPSSSAISEAIEHLRDAPNYILSVTPESVHTPEPVHTVERAS